MTKIKEGKWAAQQYQIHTPDQLKQKIDKSTDLSEVKQIAYEAVRCLQTQETKTKPRGSYMVKKRKIIDEQRSCTLVPQVTDDWEPRYVSRDMSHEQSNAQTSDTEQVVQQFNDWHLCDHYYQPTIDADVYSRPEGDVTTLTPLAIPEQPEGKWFDALANTPAIAMPLETLKWLCAPDSPSLGKRTYNSDTGPTSPVYGPAEYNAMTGPDRPTPRLTALSGLNGQDNPEDREAKKPQIRAIRMTEVHRRIR